MHTTTGELFMALPHELSVLSEQALRKERVVQSLQAAIPPIARGALVRSLVINEVVGTNDLEGIRSTRKQINELLESSSASEHMGQKRFRELAKLYLEWRPNLRGVQTEAEIVDLGEKSQRLGECHDLLGRAGSDLALTERESELLYLLVQHDLFAAFPSIQLEEATAYMRMGRQSTRKHLGSLVEKGLVSQVGSRPLRFELSADGRRLLEG
ncbi:hypothetical protein [Parafannyhessea umbonata]|uniref:Uncharacterized protein n=1 Tax=Parafannyhessea umbonata TaxID=604330 RepID=A0A6N7X8B2_9ACTN|nr:hypothetical protein [Parafannyhessea umbonata]MST59803.1 hypothetical protein [Parafannyhessea umbonata]